MNVTLRIGDTVQRTANSRHRSGPYGHVVSGVMLMGAQMVCVCWCDEADKTEYGMEWAANLYLWASAVGRYGLANDGDTAG